MVPQYIEAMIYFWICSDPNGEASNDRAVLNLTIRDSPQYFINVSRWGTLDVLSKEADSLQIGDVGEYFWVQDIRMYP